MSCCNNMEIEQMFIEPGLNDTEMMILILKQILIILEFLNKCIDNSNYLWLDFGK